MLSGSIFCHPGNPATEAASNILSQLGLSVSFSLQDDCKHLLLPIPSFKSGSEYLNPFIHQLPHDVIISGGNLSSPALKIFSCVDFLSDPFYLAENAAITARCAVKILRQKTSNQLHAKKILILGFGRIGKCLCNELSSYDCDLYVSARKQSDLASIHSLGMHAIPIADLPYAAPFFDAILNTIPAMVLTNYRERQQCPVIELASSPGIEGQNIISALGLPSKIAPEESGALIAKTFIRLSL